MNHIICLKSVCLSVDVRRLQVAILARSPREMSQTDRILPRYFLSRVRVSVRHRFFVIRKNIGAIVYFNCNRSAIGVSDCHCVDHQRHRRRASLTPSWLDRPLLNGRDGGACLFVCLVVYLGMHINCVCVYACVRACVRRCVRVCVRALLACVRACVRACMYLYVCVCARANSYVRVYMRTCVRVCKRACVRAYVRAYVRACGICFQYTIIIQRVPCYSIL